MAFEGRVPAGVMVGAGALCPLSLTCDLHKVASQPSPAQARHDTGAEVQVGSHCLHLAACQQVVVARFKQLLQRKL